MKFYQKTLWIAFVLLSFRFTLVACEGGGTAPDYSDVRGYWTEVDLDDQIFFDGDGGWIWYEEAGDVFLEGALEKKGRGYVFTEVNLGTYGVAEFDGALRSFTLDCNGTIYEFTRDSGDAASETATATSGGGTTDIEFTIYNYSTATIYFISLTPPGVNFADSPDAIVLYDDFDNRIPAKNTDAPYTVSASIPDSKMIGTWQLHVKVKREVSAGFTPGGSTHLDFVLSDGINGFSMHDMDDSITPGIMAHNGPPDFGDDDDGNGYEPGAGENDWNGVYDNGNGVFLRIFNFDGGKFEFEFYLPSSSGVRVVHLGGTASITPNGPSEAIYDTVTFGYVYTGAIFVMDSGEYRISSGMYHPEGGYGDE